jgi:hypothetical protein
LKLGSRVGRVSPQLAVAWLVFGPDGHHSQPAIVTKTTANDNPWPADTLSRTQPNPTPPPLPPPEDEADEVTGFNNADFSDFSSGSDSD